MEALVVLAFVALLALLSSRFGHDSSPHLQSSEERLARSGFAVDNETLTVQRTAGRQSIRDDAAGIQDGPVISKVATTG